MNKFLKNEWFLLVLVFIPLIISFLVYPSLPEQIPTHWNIKGEVDNYSSKPFGAFFIPALNIFIYIAFIFFPNLDPKKNNYQKFASSYRFIRLVFHLFMLLIYILVISAALGYSTDIGLWVSIAVSLLIITIGNILSRVRHNYFVGFKLPWTLANEEVWRKTHLLGSKLMVAGGIFSLIGVIFTDGFLRFILLMIGIFLPIIITSIYSYLYYKKILKKD